MNFKVLLVLQQTQGGKRGGGRGGGGNLTPWVIIQCFSFNTLGFFGFSISKKKKDSSLLLNFKVLKLAKKEELNPRGFCSSLN